MCFVYHGLIWYLLLLCHVCDLDDKLLYKVVHSICPRKTCKWNIYTPEVKVAYWISSNIAIAILNFYLLLPL